jgi:phosphoheptose isomerase
VLRTRGARPLFLRGKETRERIEAHIRESIRVKEEMLRTQLPVIERVAGILIDCLRRGGKVLLCGDGSRLKSACELYLVVPSNHTWHIQEAHITAGHVLCELVEKPVCGG